MLLFTGVALKSILDPDNTVDRVIKSAPVVDIEPYTVIIGVIPSCTNNTSID